MTAVPELANVTIVPAGSASATAFVPLEALMRTATSARLPMTDALARVIRRARRRGPVGERCDFCGVELPEEHRHLLDTDRREISCVCQACSLLFNRAAASDGHYRLVPRRRIRLPDMPRRAWACRSAWPSSSPARAAPWTRTTRARPGRPGGRSTRRRGTTS